MTKNIVRVEFNAELENNTKITYEDGSIIEIALDEHKANMIRNGIEL